jgi:hypothetical protein
MRAVHRNRAETVLGSIGSRGAPRGTDTRWEPTASGGESGVGVVMMYTTPSAINVWHAQIRRTLTVSADPGTVRRGG